MALVSAVWTGIISYESYLPSKLDPALIGEQAAILWNVFSSRLTLESYVLVPFGTFPQPPSC